jgi:glycerate-2-kinase
VLVLVISDVIGDPLEVIGSGPFVVDQSTAAEAIEMLRRHGLWGTLPRIEAVLEAGRNAAPADHSWESRVTHTIIGNNQMAVRAAVRCVEKLGYEVARPFIDCEGDVERVAAKLLGARATGGKQAWVLGGEWVVNASGTSGVGGPSQELALRAAVTGQGERGWAMLAYSTDGIDGPTSAAGAVVCGETVGRMRAAGIDAAASLANHDSHAALKASGDLITTGLTGTNVNHIAVLVRDL